EVLLATFGGGIDAWGRPRLYSPGPPREIRPETQWDGERRRQEDPRRFGGAGGARARGQASIGPGLADTRGHHRQAALYRRRSGDARPSRQPAGIPALSARAAG